MKRLVLMGAGHAHLIVLQHLRKSRLQGVELIVVTPSRWQYYSGMIPGWIAGHYGIEQCRIEVEPLVTAAGGKLMMGSVVAVMADHNQIRLADGQIMSYDFLSIDVGAKTDLTSLTGYAGQVISIKPLEDFHQQWQQFAASGNLAEKRLVIMGGGAAGVELAMAIAHAGQQAVTGAPHMTLITGSQGLLPDFSQCMRRLTSRQLARYGIDVVELRATGAGQVLSLSDGRSLVADLVMAVTGSVPFSFLSDSGLETDDSGFVLVNACHQSTSHPKVFAAGDVCARTDQALSRSGVHAVRAGPVLAANLMAAMEGGSLAAFKPRTHTLYLIACGDKTATGSYGPFAVAGKWVWALKDRIDRGFVSGFPRRLEQ